MCFDNVKIFIFVNDVFGKLIVICVGKMKNVVYIIVKISGIVIFDWKKKFWKKCVYENGELMLVIVKSSLECVKGILDLIGIIGKMVGGWINYFFIKKEEFFFNEK